jgi:hypothetical protein
MGEHVWLCWLSRPYEKFFCFSFTRNSEKESLYIPVSKIEPISKDVFIELCEKVQDSTDLLIVRNLTMILLSFAILLCLNYMLVRDGYVIINIKKSTTHQYRQGNEIFISKVLLACTNDIWRLL